jgi:hypothetical protein
MQKVNVVALFGAGAQLGLMDPKVGMVTDQGTITVLDSGNFLVTVSGLNVGDPTRFYPSQLFVTRTEATGHWSFPTGDGSLSYAHLGQATQVAQGSGFTVWNGEKIVSVSRPPVSP